MTIEYSYILAFVQHARHSYSFHIQYTLLHILSKATVWSELNVIMPITTTITKPKADYIIKTEIHLRIVFWYTQKSISYTHYHPSATRTPTNINIFTSSSFIPISFKMNRTFRSTALRVRRLLKWFGISNFL